MSNPHAAALSVVVRQEGLTVALREGQKGNDDARGDTYGVVGQGGAGRG